MMTNLRIINFILLAGYVAGLPDFSHLVQGGSPEHPADDDFKYGPFFKMFVGTPPPPETPPPFIEHPPATHPPISHPPPSNPHPNPNPDLTTRTSFYQYHWGGVSEGCRYKAPRSILKCMEGGILLLAELENADCEPLALDVVKCSQIDPGADAIVDFQCVGNTPWHLAANARTLPSEAEECSKFDGSHYGGNAVAAASLGRYCKDSTTGDVTLDNSYACVEGQPSSMEGKNFCTSMNQCSGRDCVLFVEPISITAYDEDESCSTPEIHQDLTNFNFNPSSLASYHAVKWTFSDAAFNCDWTVPDVEFGCRNGGILRIAEEKDFCHTPIGTNLIVCTNPDTVSEDGRITIDLEFWCYGDIAEQLTLDFRTLPTDSSGYSCEPEGLLVHGVDIARGCGDSRGDAFTLFKSPSFCAYSEQYHQDLCFAGFNCPAADLQGCANITLDSVAGDTSDLMVGSCIYAEQLAQ